MEVEDGSTLDLAEISPIGDVTLAGQATASLHLHGVSSSPRIDGHVRAVGLSVGGLAVGELDVPRVVYSENVVDLFDVHMRHNRSHVHSSHLRAQFDKGSKVALDADLDAREAPGLAVRDVLGLVGLDNDPRLALFSGAGSGSSRVHYVVGGKEDICGGGVLRIDASMDVDTPQLLGERFERGHVDVGILWDDHGAGLDGMQVDLHSATLEKGEGSILGGHLRHGGYVEGTIVGSALPVSKL